MTRERNYGIDALRIVSMLGIVLMHILYKGGLLDATGLRGALLWLVEIICYCAVNCYAIISGYVRYTEEERPYRYRSYIGLWLGVFFWSFGITLVCMILRTDGVGIKELIRSALPVMSNAYWYFSAYTVLFFVIPWIDRALRGRSEREITGLVLTLFVLFSIVGLLYDPFEVNYGYSFVWLAFLYIVGAWMKKCDIPHRLKTGTALLASAVCVLVSWLVFLFSPVRPDMFVKYISPTMVVYAVCVVALFARWRIGARLSRGIAWLAPTSFGVYIIHVHPLIECRFADWFGWIGELGLGFVLISLALCLLVMFSLCALLEEIRLILHRKIQLENRIMRFLQKRKKNAENP